MPNKKIDSYFESPEFPGLGREVGELRERIADVCVKRFDENFVNDRHITTIQKEVLSIDEDSDEATELVSRVVVDDVRLLDANFAEVDRVNQRLYYKTPVIWWKPWTWYKYGEEPYFCTQRPFWFFEKPQRAVSIRTWLSHKRLPDVHFVLHFKPSAENHGRLSLIIRKESKSSSGERMSLQRYINSLGNEVATEVTAIDAKPNSN